MQIGRRAAPPAIHHCRRLDSERGSVGRCPGAAGTTRRGRPPSTADRLGQHSSTAVPTPSTTVAGSVSECRFHASLEYHGTCVSCRSLAACDRRRRGYGYGKAESVDQRLAPPTDTPHPPVTVHNRHPETLRASKELHIARHDPVALPLAFQRGVAAAGANAKRIIGGV